MTDLHALQEKIGKLSSKLGHAEDPKVVMLFLLEELGEATRAYLKEDGFKEDNDRVAETFKEELGDVFYLLLRLAYVTNTNLETSVEHTFEKLENSSS